MSWKLYAAAASALCLAAGLPARAQNFLGADFNRMNNDLTAQMNARMAQQQQQIVQNNLNDPQVMAAYRAGVCGPGLTPQQFAYKYAATGGCTAQGYANYNNTSRQIANSDAAAMQRYRDAQAARAEAMAAQRQGYANNQYQQGMMLGGWRWVQTPSGPLWYRP